MKRLPKRRAKLSKFQFSFPQTPKLPKSWQKYPLFYSLWLIFELFFTKCDKNNPDFWQKWQKKTFFRARSARGGGRHATRQIDPPKFTAKTTAKTQPPNSTHTHFWNSTSHHTPSTFGIPLFIDRLQLWNSTIYRSPPIMEFHYLQIASTFGIPLPIIHPPLLEFHYLYIAPNYGIPTIVLTTITAIWNYYL